MRAPRIALCLLAALGANGLAAQSGSAAKPNIILVMPDDIGYGDYACLGNPIIKTPAVDEFWKESVRLTEFHVSPTCAPTRAALLSGRHEFRNGVSHTILERERLSLKTVTLAQVLKGAGYVTGIFGKWHLGDEPAYQPDKRGFDEVYIHGGGGIGQTYPGSCGDAPGNSYTNPALLHNGTFKLTTGYCTDLFFAQAIRWMDSVRKEKKPFFVYITPNVAHTPLDCPEENYKHYAGKVPQNTARFYGMIETLDVNFGRLVRQLASWNIERNTVVFFLGSDNGGTAGVKVFNDGMRGTKGTPYRGGTRVPCFIRWPDRFAGGRDIPTLTAHIDLFPTLVEISGADLNRAVRRQIEGRSLLPLLEGSTASGWDDRFLITHVGRWPRGKTAEAKFSGCAIRNSRFALVNNSQLFDIFNDPGESRNVITNHPGTVCDMRAAYEKWWMDIQPFLVNENAVGPAINPFKALYWRQFGGGPTAEDLEVMKPSKTRQGTATTPVF